MENKKQWITPEVNEIEINNSSGTVDDGTLPAGKLAS